MLKLSQKPKVKKWITIIGDENGVQAGITNPTHKEILQAQVDEGPFMKAMSEYRDDIMKWKDKYDALESVNKEELNAEELKSHEEKQMNILEEYNRIVFKDVNSLKTITDFIIDHIVEIKGVTLEDSEGKEVEAVWSDLSHEFKQEIIDNITLHDIGAIYNTIKSLSALDPNV